MMTKRFFGKYILDNIAKSIIPPKPHFMLIYT